ncbi:MAG TPA: DUF3426 domain-containing protein [Spongiibacteraceae bacterium]|nr:DUF3426 domain-containing protein [Spongiibacteraceae bacterium]
MDHRITQCPRCGTSFRVTEAHLAVAAGAVRCGSCLHIFNAREHWVEDKPAPPPQPEAPISAQSLEEFTIDDDALFDDNTPLFAEDNEPARNPGGVIFNPVDDDFALIDDSEPEQLTPNFIELNSWEQDVGSSFGRATETDDEPLDKDEAWTEHLLHDDTSPFAPSIAADRSMLEDYGDAILEQVPETDEQELNAEFLDIPSIGSNASPTNNADQPIDYPIEQEPVDQAEPLVMDSLYATEPPAPTAEHDPLHNLHDLGTEPLELHRFVHEPRWPKVLWSLGLIAALALLVGQVIYANFNTLAHGSARPWLAQACALANCRLPPQSDLSQVRASSLIVRSHPTQHGALAVDAIITNLATFPQPYPLLQLQFADLNGAPVAGRRFTPAEYLAGELSGSQLMPVQQPVHIALEIVDPGPQAVNYSLTVAPSTGTPAPPSGRAP